MKKILLLALALCLVFALAACKPVAPCEHADENYDGVCDKGCGTKLDVDVMTYEEYVAAELESFVVIEAYVQAHQSWWDNKITVYLADEDGAYFAYEMACSEEDAAKLTAGTKIRVYGTKTEWEGEVEIGDCAFTFVEADPYIAPAIELNDKLGTDDLIKYQNHLAVFRGLEVVSVEYKNGQPGDDIYLNVKHGENTYSFCVERYLTAPDTEVYAAVGELKAGDIIDIEAFLYWYGGANPHVVSVKGGYMTDAEYAAAEIGAEVKILSYVQAKQSWWDNKGTFYLQSADGAVFAYEMACTEEMYNKLTVGTKAVVEGFKGEWSGEIEVMDGAIYFVGGDTYTAEAVDITDKLGTDELINYQNHFVKFTDMTVAKIEYKNNEPGDDIYITLSKDGAKYSFCIEIYLTGAKTELYELVAKGFVTEEDVVDVECFLYWYNGMNPHITAIKNINE